MNSKLKMKIAFNANQQTKGKKRPRTLRVKPDRHVETRGGGAENESESGEVIFRLIASK